MTLSDRNSSVENAGGLYVLTGIWPPASVVPLVQITDTGSGPVVGSSEANIKALSHDTHSSAPWFVNGSSGARPVNLGS